MWGFEIVEIVVLLSLSLLEGLVMIENLALEEFNDSSGGSL
jgi:hypothetical protein